MPGGTAVVEIIAERSIWTIRNLESEWSINLSGLPSFRVLSPY